MWVFKAVNRDNCSSRLNPHQTWNCFSVNLASTPCCCFDSYFILFSLSLSASRLCWLEGEMCRSKGRVSILSPSVVALHNSLLRLNLNASNVQAEKQWDIEVCPPPSAWPPQRSGEESRRPAWKGGPNRSSDWFRTKAHLPTAAGNFLLEKCKWENVPLNRFLSQNFSRVICASIMCASLHVTENVIRRPVQ